MPKPNEEGSSEKEISGARRAAVSALISVMLVATAFCTFMRRDYFPFSYYPMYASVKSDMLYSAYRVYGLTASGVEIAIDDSIAPFDRLRLRTAFSRMKTEQERKVGLAYVLDRYNHLHSGLSENAPRLSRVRLYKMSWHMNASNPDTLAPVKREIIAECTALQS